MPGNVFHVPALDEQIVNFTKIGIINNLGDPALGHTHDAGDLLPGPPQTAKADDSDVPVSLLADSDIRDPGIYGLPGNN